MTYLTRTVFLCLIVLPFFFATSCDRVGVRQKKIMPSGNSVTIGIVAPMTGLDDPKGNDGLRGIKTILHEQPFLNNGDEITFIVEDDQNQPELSVNAFKKLVEKEKVAAVLILSTSESVLLINNVADQYKMPVITTIASHPEIARQTRFMNQLCVDNTFQGKVAALYARDELLVTRVAVLEDTNSEYSISLAEIFKKQFSKLDGEADQLLMSSDNREDLREQLLSFKQLNTEMLYMPVRAEKFIMISEILEDIQWNPIRMGSDGLLSTVLAKYEDKKTLMNEVIAPDFYSKEVNRSLFGGSLLREYRSLFREKPNTYTVAAAEGMALLINAMNRCQNPDSREEISEEIRETINFRGFNGRINIKADGKSERPLVINTIKDGSLKFVVRVH